MSQHLLFPSLCMIVALGCDSSKEETASDTPEDSAPQTSYDEIQVGEVSWEVRHTPGHSPGGCCLYFDRAAVVLEELGYTNVTTVVADGTLDAAGDIINYTITVTNSGAAPATTASMAGPTGRRMMSSASAPPWSRKTIRRRR